MSYEPSDAKSLFLQAVELTDSQQRRDFLDRVCRGNAELRRRVEQLLESHDDPGSLLRQPVLAEWRRTPRGDGGSASHAATGEYRVTRDSTQPMARRHRWISSNRARPPGASASWGSTRSSKWSDTAAWALCSRRLTPSSSGSWPSSC